jgi:nucleotide-binding universal stress UspA family protein
MIARLDPLAIRRILVALDASSDSLVALEAAVELAGRVEAELEGLFIEDINLMRLAELPIAQQLSLPTGLRQRLELAAIEGEMRALAEEARRALEEAAEGANLRWSFRVVRGRLEAEMAAAAGEVDLIVLNTAARRLSHRAGLTAVAEQAAKQLLRSILLLRGRAGPAKSVAVAFDGSPGADKALAAAARMAAGLEEAGVVTEGAILTVLCVGDTKEAARKAERKAKGWLKRKGLEAEVTVLGKASPPRLCEAVRHAGSGLLVLDADAPLLEGIEPEGLIDQTGCPVLLVR